MRNKFTKQAQTALTLAKAAAIDFELGYIGTEHLLLGLLSETEGTAGRVLEEFQVDGKKLVELIDKLVTPAEVGNITEIEMKPSYSPRTEKVLESAVAEAQNSGCEKAGTEHLLLAMLRETDCVGTRLLYTMGVISRSFMQQSLEPWAMTMSLFRKSSRLPRPCKIPEAARHRHLTSTAVI